ncbi:MAG: hypothetical protein AAB177_07700 [Nitrospirota bacterium]
MPISSLIESAPEGQSLMREYPETNILDAIILDHLSEQAVISLDSLISLMPQYTWNQIFYSVDQLARGSKIVLRRHRFEYMLFSTHFVA